MSALTGRAAQSIAEAKPTPMPAQSLEDLAGPGLRTFFKKDGVFENPADQSRVEELMAVVKGIRK